MVAIVSTNAKPVTLGDNHTILCNVSGSTIIQQHINYKWWHFNGTNSKEIEGRDSNTLTLSPLKLTNAGEYTCEVEIDSTEVSSSAKFLSKSSYILSLSGKSNNKHNQCTKLKFVCF